MDNNFVEEKLGHIWYLYSPKTKIMVTMD